MYITEQHYTASLGYQRRMARRRRREFISSLRWLATAALLGLGVDTLLTGFELVRLHLRWM